MRAARMWREALARVGAGAGAAAREMRAVVVREAGRLEVCDVPLPPFPPARASPREPYALIRVAHAGVNRADLLQRAGHYSPPPDALSPLLGLEVHGTLLALSHPPPSSLPNADDEGDASATALAEQLRPGADVVALLDSGGYAQYAVAPLACVLPRPAHIHPRAAAALPEAHAAAQMLLQHAFPTALASTRIKPTVRCALVFAAGSSVGLTLIQQLSSLLSPPPARIVAVAGAARKLAAARRFGAHVALDRHAPDYAAQLRAALRDMPADAVFDCVGRAALESGCELVANDARWVLYGALSGRRAQLDLAQLLARRLTISAVTLRSRSAEYKAALMRTLWRSVWPRFEDGALPPPLVDAVYELEDVAAAHDRLRLNSNTGKVILRVQ